MTTMPEAEPKLATLVRVLQSGTTVGHKQDAKLYRLSTPLETYDHLIISAVHLNYGGPHDEILETMVVGSDAGAHWTEYDLPGTQYGVWVEHNKVLRDLGYELVEA